ncbi:hypothetical protein ACJZ2D_008254 [Fusarium nematophilum]
MGRSVYCSAATREILLRLERYPCRVNYAQGILESRQQTYKHLKRVLKAVPLETPTTLELRPGREIQVTLFDANHCPGAVMFLIEDDNKAVLYTGDIRSEPWFVNTISRSPSLIEYTSGIKALDKIYLDTSFIEDVPFQTKAQGMAELLRKVARYPSETVFHIQAWTYGYENVWVALSKALKSRIHVDDYKLRIYDSLSQRPSGTDVGSQVHLTTESPALTGYMCGNSPHPGCLTSDENVRLHCCEKGNMCEAARRSSTVSIQPIVAHLPTGQDLVEVGVGGGGDDLQREAELDFLDQTSLAALVDLIFSSDTIPTETLEAVKEVLTEAVSTGRNIPLDQDIGSIVDLSPQDAVLTLAQKLRESSKNTLAQGTTDTAELPRIIHFPYSRHSSYPELCHFVEAFRPRDVWPCTVSPIEWLKNGTSIESLFGRFCSGNVFQHDIFMRSFAERHALNDPRRQHDSQTTVNSFQLPSSPPNEVYSPEDLVPRDFSSIPTGRIPITLVSPPPATQDEVDTAPEQSAQAPQASSPSALNGHLTEPEIAKGAQHHTEAPEPHSTNRKRSFSDLEGEADETGSQAPIEASESFSSITSEQHSLTRRDAYRQMLQNMTSDTWVPIYLISTSNEFTVLEEEL